MDSYAKFMEMAMKPKETGVYLRQSVFYFKNKVRELPGQLDKMTELCHLPGFRHDEKLIEESGKFNPLRPNNDLSQTSHCNIKGLSVSEVMRIENMTTC